MAFLMKKTMQILSTAFFGLFIRTKGMGEIFHDQTKGYMFACDQLHTCNIP
jgi:hypothetical protein